MSTYLTKSDFKAAQTCGTKLYYRKLKYPANRAGDDYLSFLADGGYLVEEIARAKFPSGRLMPDVAPEEAVAETRQAMTDRDVTLFEASFLAGKLLARVDILEKQGQLLRLVEVKSKSFESSGGSNVFRTARGKIVSEYLPYLEDVAFQTLVLQRLYPQATIVPCLALVDKSAVAEFNAIFKHFSLRREEEKYRPLVTFAGDRDLLRRSQVVRILDVTDEVAELLPEVERAADELAATLSEQGLKRIEPELGAKCKNCEFRYPVKEEPDRHGFRDCWGDSAAHEHHLLDLHRVDQLEKSGHFTRLVSSGVTSLHDVNPDILSGSYAGRQELQLEYTKKGQEYIAPTLPRLLKKCRYPLHFVDFEASRLAIPYHQGMRPYEQVLFQWSCHSLTKPNGELSHREWINVADAYPNFEFARTLRDAIGEGGTVFVWSSFERTGLKEVLGQMTRYGVQDPELTGWLQRMVGSGSPLYDLLELARGHYFHPRMKGSLSIKHVLPAVWQSSQAIREHSWFQEYRSAAESEDVNPYDTLPALPFGDAEETEVRDGVAAMRTYQEMMYGANSSDPEFRSIHRQALLNYCKLDTAAMVMIWLRWTGQA